MSKKSPIIIPATLPIKPPKLSPVGTETFDAIIEKNAIYVDKTAYLTEWMAEAAGSTNIVLRPRRFGKTISFSTIAAIYNKRTDLLIETQISQEFWDHFIQRPVIRLNFLSRTSGDPVVSLNIHLKRRLLDQARHWGIKQPEDEQKDALILLGDILSRLNEKFGQRSVVMIDEYDALINYAYHEGKDLRPCSAAITEYFSTLKSCSDYIHASYITGIMKYRGLGLFTALSSPQEITFRKKYAQMIGFTLEEVTTYFQADIEEVSHRMSMDTTSFLAKMKSHYNGYSFCPDALNLKVYSSYSVSKFFQEACFADFWYNTGGLSTLYFRATQAGPEKLQEIDLLVQNRGVALEGYEDLTGGQDTGTTATLNIKTLLLYHGYLTFESQEGNKASLKFPNIEVTRAFNRTHLEYTLGISSTSHIKVTSYLKEQVEAQNIQEIMRIFAHIVAFVPAINHFAYENFYQTLIGVQLACIYGDDVSMERAQATGTPDLILTTKNITYIFEFKYIASHANHAPIVTALKKGIKQIDEKRYTQTSLFQNRQIYTISIAISGRKNNIVAYMIGSTPSECKLECNKPFYIDEKEIQEFADASDRSIHLERFNLPLAVAEKTSEYKIYDPSTEKRKEIDFPAFTGDPAEELAQIIPLSDRYHREVLSKDPEGRKKKSKEWIAAMAEVEKLIQKEKENADLRVQMAHILLEKEKAQAQIEKEKALAEIEKEKAQAKTEKEKERFIIKTIFRLKNQNMAAKDIANVLDISPEEWLDLTGESL